MKWFNRQCDRLFDWLFGHKDVYDLNPKCDVMFDMRPKATEAYMTMLDGALSKGGYRTFFCCQCRSPVQWTGVSREAGQGFLYVVRCHGQQEEVRIPDFIIKSGNQSLLDSYCQVFTHPPVQREVSATTSTRRIVLLPERKDDVA